MKTANGKILVQVRLDQKDEIEIGGVITKSALLFEKNYRERSPVIAEVIEGNEYLKSGDIIVTHHNHFQMPSPYHLSDEYFSIPFGKTIFGLLDREGNLSPICDNMICKTIPIPSLFPLPLDQQKDYINRYIVELSGWTKYKKGTIILTRPHSGYVIVYNFNNSEKRVLKVSDDMVCGIVKN